MSAPSAPFRMYQLSVQHRWFFVIGSQIYPTIFLRTQESLHMDASRMYIIYELPEKATVPCRNWRVSIQYVQFRENPQHHLLLPLLYGTLRYIRRVLTFDRSLSKYVHGCAILLFMVAPYFGSNAPALNAPLGTTTLPCVSLLERSAFVWGCLVRPLRLCMLSHAEGPGGGGGAPCQRRIYRQL